MINYRLHGEKPYSAVLIHGGPGAPGEMLEVSEKLSRNFGVLEPLQTKDSIAGQVEELFEIIKEKCKPPVILIGWSWGAWLSAIFASIYPRLVSKLILVGSGPFDSKYAPQIMSTRMKRLKRRERRRVGEILQLLNDAKNKNKNSILSEFGEILAGADNYSMIDGEKKNLKVNIKIYQKVWSQAEKLRKSGKLMEYIKKIKSPIVIVHGDYDPHPVEGITKPLERINKNFKLILLSRCGHKPWIEKYTKDKFYKIIEEERNLLNSQNL